MMRKRKGDNYVFEGQESETNEKKSGRRLTRGFSGKSAILPWLLLFIVLAAGIGGTLYYKNRAEKVESDPAAAQAEKNQVETDRVLSALKRTLLVNEQDAPTVARIEDPEKLKQSNPDFYKDIQVGDYLIIYPKRAIVYRENADLIINIAPIINTSELQQRQEESSQQPAAESEDE